MKQKLSVVFVLIILTVLVSGVHYWSLNHIMDTDAKEVFNMEKGHSMEQRHFMEEENSADEDEAAIFALTGKTLQELNEEILVKQNGNDTGIWFSQKEHFYSHSIEVAIQTDKPAQIYYTLDGSIPDQNARKYLEPLVLEAFPQERTYNLSAQAFYEDGSSSGVIVHTYFMGEEIEERYDTLVFSITTDPDHLYDYETGILIPGKLRDDFEASYPDVIYPSDPANYNMRGIESERPVFLEVFDSEGNRVLNQDAGIRVFGGWSRDYKQKSYKLFARSEYDLQKNDFDYVFFPQVKIPGGEIADSYKRLILSNSGSDYTRGFIANALLLQLAAEAGIQDAQAYRPASVYVNGDYHGFYWLQEVYSKDYFKNHYGKYEGEFVTLKGGELYKIEDNDTDNSQYRLEYQQMYEYSTMDLTDEEIYSELRNLMDVENYLDYYAFQLYINNRDWPHNNYKTYRYYPGEDDSYEDNPFDGKWRFLLYDLDHGFDAYEIFTLLVNESWIPKLYEGESPMFTALMERHDCKEYFIKKTLDLLNGVFSPEYFSEALDSLHTLREKELETFLDSGHFDEELSLADVENRIKHLEEFALLRGDFVLDIYQEIFNLGDVYTLQLRMNEGDGLIAVNGITISDDFAGKYYNDYNTILMPDLYVGKGFSHWSVNGEKFFEERLVITKDMVKDGKVDVVLYVQDIPVEKQLIISEYSAKGLDDYIILYNPTDETLSTVGYQISDNPEKPNKMILPKQWISPGESLRIICDNFTDSSTLGQYYAPFNLKEGETIVLSYNNTVIEEVEIPTIKTGYYLKRDLKTGVFEKNN